MVEAWRVSERSGDGFAVLGGHSACHEASRSFRWAHGGPAPPPSLDSLAILLVQVQRE